MSTHTKENVRPLTGEGTRDRLVRDMGLSERRLELANISTAVLEGGDGPPIILLHGQGEFAATWTPVVPDLATTHRVVAPDLPGHGDTEIGTGRLDAGQMLEWLGELITETCKSPPVLVGHLLGGSIAARFAVAHGDRLASLVLVDTLGLARFWPATRFTVAMIGFMARPSERTQDRLFRQCFVDLDRLRDEGGAGWRSLETYALDRARGPGVKAALRSLMPHVGVPAIPAGDLEKISVHTTLIHGRHDLQVPLRIAEAASARYGWPLHVIEGAADDPAVEQPDAFLTAFRSAVDTA